MDIVIHTDVLQKGCEDIALRVRARNAVLYDFYSLQRNLTSTAPGSISDIDWEGATCKRVYPFSFESQGWSIFPVA